MSQLQVGINSCSNNDNHARLESLRGLSHMQEYASMRGDLDVRCLLQRKPQTRLPHPVQRTYPTKLAMSASDREIQIRTSGSRRQKCLPTMKLTWQVQHCFMLVFMARPDSKPVATPRCHFGANINSTLQMRIIHLVVIASESRAPASVKRK